MVHDALGKLYDSLSLQQHALTALLQPVQNTPTQRGQDMRRLLLAGIRGMRPAPGVPATSPDWRAYRLLELRYIEGLDPQEAMRQLGLAKSQYYREQARAIDSVTALLWEQYQAEHALNNASRQELIRAEAERLSASGQHDGLDDTALLADLAAVVEPLARARGIEARLLPVRSLRAMHADRVVLRQAILAAVSAAVNLPAARQLELRDLSTGHERGVCVRAWPAGSGLPEADLELCRSLAAALEATVTVLSADDILEVRLMWPAGPPNLLLVIDDNVGLIELFRRYLAGHPWRVLSAGNGLEAREVMAADRPDVVIVDVMMPREDGWQFLLAMKTSAPLRDIPVVVCSVLEQPQIALTLGAAAYLPKPVTQQALLQTLAPWSR
jgi:CheY-like chemotaxis protein